MREKCIVHYQIATYSGEITVICDENDDKDRIIAKAKTILKNTGGKTSLPMYYESFKIISREPADL
jgi:hypothetical protein